MRADTGRSHLLANTGHVGPDDCRSRAEVLGHPETRKWDMMN